MCLGAFYFGYALGELNMALEKLGIAYDIDDSDYTDIYEGTYIISNIYF